MFKNFLTVQRLFESYYLTEARGSNSAEDWLAKYTYENLDKWPTEENLAYLLKQYPYDGGTLYRGLNFHDEEQYKNFLEETKNGTEIEIGSISSWTRTPDSARQFALTRPTYFLNRELMQAESQKNKDRDYMIGHAGLILETVAGSKDGIDVNLSKHGKEDEVILKPGRYKIGIYKTYMPFMKSVHAGNAKEHFHSIKDMHSGSRDDGPSDSQKFDHITFRFRDLFDEDMQKHLFKLISAKLTNVKYQVELDDRFDVDTWGKMGKTPEIRVHWNIPGEFFTHYDLLLPEDAEKISKKMQTVMKQIDREFDKKLKGFDWKNQKIFVQVDDSIRFAAKEGHVHAEFLKHIQRGAAARYHELNSYDRLKEINKLSGREQEAAMQKFVKDIEQTLKNLTGSR